MQRRIVPVLTVLSIFLIAFATGCNSEEKDMEALIQAMEDYENAWAAGDFMTVESFFAEDAKRLHTEPWVWDREEIKRYFEERAAQAPDTNRAFVKNAWKTEREYVDIRIEGDIAYDIFTTDRFKALHIWSRQEDGSWKILYDMGALHGPDPETFPPLADGKAPQTYGELWDSYNPRREALDVEVLHEWEEDGVIMQVLRYRIGVFKGQKAMMAAIYGYPKDGKDLPGLVQVHGGGQYADYRAVLTNGKRGYATISLSWAGRINAPDYHVNPDGVKLFWEGDTANPDYKVTTDWGPLDGYHAPCRNPGNNFGGTSPETWTLDSIESPRNNPWFLCAVGARRAITFLEEQEVVDRNKIGVYGHSMGGKITVLTAADPRIRAAAPSCGGISNNVDDPLYQNTIADNTYLAEISCPIIFLSPSNDFHGHFGDLPKAVDLVQSKEWRIASSAHHSHQDAGEFEVTGLLWFDQHLKGTFSYPETPETELVLETGTGTPSLIIRPDPSVPFMELEVYYTQQGENFREVSDRDNRKNRFWHYAKAVKDGDSWKADLPLGRTDRPLWAYANVRYGLDEAVTCAGYYYRVYTTETFNISSLVKKAFVEQLQAAGAAATLEPSLLIEDFQGDWQKDWFFYKPDKWELKTHKLYNELWEAPENARLAFEIRSAEANLMVVGIDGFAREIELDGGNNWQQFVLSPGDFMNNEGEALPGWSDIKEFTFSAKESFRITADGEPEVTVLGGDWKGERPEFKNLRWH